MTGRLDDLLAASAVRTPDAPALADAERSLTYEQLDGEVDKLAADLEAGGVRAGHRVGIHLSRGIPAVRAIYAVLRARAVAAPLDRTDPPGRIARAATGAGLDFLLTSSASPDAAEQVRKQVTAAGGHLDVGDLRLVALRPVTRPASEDGYILFTSGSTGRPKGVLLAHGNVLHFVRWAVRTLGVSAADRIGAQAALTFDLSTFDIFGAAAAGACAVLLPEELKIFPREVVNWLRRERVSVFYAVPTMYRAMADKGGITSAAVPDLRVCAFAGEPFPPQALESCLREFPDREWWNLYGPTETNVCTYTRVPADWRAADGLSIGRPVDGLHATLVDGEIAIAGPAVFRGYLTDGELRDPTTELRFPDGVVRRAYLTGDLGTIDGQGRIWLSGRRDHQVKVRGNRIDLGDVESAAAALSGVRACAVVLKDGERLALYAVTEDLDVQRLRARLADTLPRRMMPHEIHLVDELPLNARGKVDRPNLAARQ